MIDKRDEFIKKARKVHGDKYDYSKVHYINNKTKVCITCPEHGEFWQMPANHTKGYGCSKCGGTKKLTTEEFIVKANKVHENKYDYSNVEYINNHTKVCIVCPEHGEFWQSPGSHLLGNGCPICGIKTASKKRKKTAEAFIEQAKVLHNNKYDYSNVEYINNHTKVCIVCPEHGEFWQTPNCHLNGQGCPNCCKNKQITTEGFIKKAREVHGDKYDYSKVNYVNNRTKVCIICPEHGEFWQTPDRHMRGQGCFNCGVLKRAEKERLTTDMFIERAKKVHGDKYDYSKAQYVDATIKICIICPEHGEFWQKPFDHLNGRGCYICNRNGGQIEEALYQYFLAKYGKALRNARFDWLGRQSIDIYLPEYKIGIEYQGEQHFIPFKHLGGEEGLKHREEMDALKNRLCKDNGVLLLYIVPQKYNNYKLFYNNKNTFVDKNDICDVVEAENKNNFLNEIIK